MAVPTLLGSIAPTTLLQYERTFKLWWDFCNNEGIPVFVVDVSKILLFFQNLLDKTNCKFGTFNSHRAALTMILPDGALDHDVLKRFFRGIYRSRPPNPKYTSVWNPQTVLNYLEKLSVDNLKNHSYKLVMLLLLATGQRLQTISLIKITNVKEDEEGLKIYIPEFVKTSGPNRTQPCLILPFFHENLNLCVASILKSYLCTTENLRVSNCSALFISYQKPYKAVTKQTLSRWVKIVMQEAGIDISIYKAHSTRHASTSLAFSRGVSIDVIRKSAGWSSSSMTFARFYNRPLDNSDSFLSSVFSK